MKKFTFIATLLMAFACMANAEVMDKYFFKASTDKDPGWTIQDAGNFVGTPGKEYYQAYNKKNGGRMLNLFFNENAWAKTSVADHPIYKFTMDLNMSSMATRADMEFVLLPVGACSATDSRVSTHNYHWFNAQDAPTATEETTKEDYFFRWRVITAPTAANGDYTIIINENPTARNNWVTSENADSILTLNSQKLYKYAVVINTTEKTATYTIADEEGTVVKTGVHNYVCAEDRAGIMVFSMNGTSTHQLSNIGLCYEAEGPFANDPSADLLAARGTERDYYATFGEGETLHWIQLGDATDAFGNSYTDGEEYQVEYYAANDKRDFDQDAENYFGSKILFCSKSGDLKMWTTRTDDESNKSEEVVIPVTCEMVTMPTPVATITNVAAGYTKEYTISADNSATLLQPTVTIHYKMNDGTEGNLASGEKINFTDAGSVELYAYDGTHPTPWYAQSEPITIENNVEYVEYSTTKYDWTKAECDAAKEGYTVLNIVDNANKSHWDRIYSDQKYGYDKDGNASVWAEGTEYVSVKEGFGFYAGTAIGTDDANWNVQVPNDLKTGLLPLIPSEEDYSIYKENAWNIFPLEGIVYYDVNSTKAVKANPAGAAGYLEMILDPQYTSDDASKPNFYIINKRGGYDRPDKGDCNSSEVVVAGEKFWLYRYDTAINTVRIMTYKGFTPGTSAISTVNADQVAAPAVKKMVTKNGIVIVKGNNTYNVAGAQMK